VKGARQRARAKTIIGTAQQHEEEPQDLRRLLISAGQGRKDLRRIRAYSTLFFGLVCGECSPLYGVCTDTALAVTACELCVV